MTTHERCSVFFTSVILLTAQQSSALAEAPNVVWEGSGKSGYLYSVAFSTDGQLVATGDGFPAEYDPDSGTFSPGEGTVRLWSANDGTLVQSATTDQSQV